MLLWQKILLFLGITALIGTLSFIVFKEVESSHRQDAIEAQVINQKQLADNIVRSQNEYATKSDIEKFIKDNGVNLKVIQDDLNKFHAEVAAVNTVTVTSSGQHSVNVPSTGVGVSNPQPVDPKNPDPYGYMLKQQNLDLTEKFNTTTVPLGKVEFSAWQKDPWTLDIYPRTYHVTNVLGTDENQRYYMYNKFTLKVGDQSYDLKIDQSDTKQEYPTAKWSWWNPALFMGADGGLNISQMKGEFTPSISLGIMSYGAYRTQPDFSVLQLGVGFGAISNKVQFLFTPFAYNIGKPIPLINNTYIGPSLHVGVNGDVAIMGGLRIGL